MFQRLFAVKFNGKKFLLFRNVKDSHIAFLEWKENGNIDYPQLEDYIALNNIYNNHDYSIFASEKIRLTEKVRWKELLLTLMIEGSIILGGVSLLSQIDPLHNAVIMDIQQAQVIKDRNALLAFFSEGVTREDVIEAINNNPNLDDYYKSRAIVVLDTNLKLDPNLDLRIYYENMKRLKIEELDYSDPTHRYMMYAEGWFNAREHTIYMWKAFSRGDCVVDHELNHAVRNLHLEEAGKSFDIYEVEGRSLDEAMTEIITNNGRTGFSLSYNTQKGLLNYFMENTENFDIPTYNKFGISPLIEELKEKYPEVDIDYIISYMDNWTISRNRQIEDLDLYNYKEYLDELFKIALANINENEPYKAFASFFEMAKDNLRQDYAYEYLNEYNEALQSRGISTEKSAIFEERIEKETDYSDIADEEVETFYEDRFQTILNNMTPETAYKDLNQFIYIYRQSEFHTYEQEAEYEKKYDEEVINRGFLTREQIDQIRSISSFIQTEDGIHLACVEHDLSFSTEVHPGCFEVFMFGRDYKTEEINENGERVPLTISGQPFKLERVWFDSNRLLAFITSHQGTPLGDITQPETKEAIAEEMNYFDNRKFNKLSNGEVLFDEMTPDMFVVIGKDENGTIGFQLVRGEEILYSTVDRFVTPTARIPYSVYPFLRDHPYNPKEEDDYIENLLSLSFLNDTNVAIDYYAPNVKRTLNPEYDVINNNEVSRFNYEFEEPIVVMIDGQEYTPKDVYFYIDFDKGYEAIDQHIMLHIPGEEDTYIGEYGAVEIYFPGAFLTLDEIMEQMGIPVPDNRELLFTKPELKDLIRQYLAADYQNGQKK